MCRVCAGRAGWECASGVWCGVWWVCAGLCRRSVLDVWGVPGVCRECAGCVLREHAWVVLRVCGVCGCVPGVCGRAWVGGVPGVCRVVCVPCKASSAASAGVWVCRERACRMWGARGCAVCRGVCVCVPGVCRQCAGCVPGVCRCVGRGCVGCVACA